MTNQLDSFKIEKLRRIPSVGGGSGNGNGSMGMTEEANLRHSQQFDRKS